jgi:hypothetical protein
VRVCALAISASLLGCSAAQLRGEGSIDVSYIIAGGAAHPGGKAPATGGAALMPAARLLLAMPVMDPYITAAPTFVAPHTLDALGFVGAFDGGASWHPAARAWHLGTAATLAPSYMRFCNASWCLKQWVALYGGEAHFGTRLVKTESEGGLTGSLSARLLTGRPTAWYWPTLTPEERDIAHLIISIGGQMTWRF